MQYCDGRICRPYSFLAAFFADFFFVAFFADFFAVFLAAFFAAFFAMVPPGMWLLSFGHCVRVSQQVG